MFKVFQIIWRSRHLALTHFICKFWELPTLQVPNCWNVLKMCWFLVLPFDDLFWKVECMFFVGYRILLLSIWKDLSRHANVRKQSVHRAIVINWRYSAYHYAIATGTASCIELNILFKWKYIVFIYGFYLLAEIIVFLGPKITQIVVQKLGSGHFPYNVGLNCLKNWIQYHLSCLTNNGYVFLLHLRWVILHNFYIR